MCTLALDPDEAHLVADLLNATVTVDDLTDFERQVTGVTAARILLPAGSPYDGRPLAATRTPAGAFIVAVIRDQQVTAAP
jgi:TrkA domain protein